MKKRTTQSKIAVKLKEPQRDHELTVTKRLLDLKIQVVKSDITSLRLEMKAGFAKIDARFTQIDARFHEQNGKFEVLDSKITQMLILMEEQNNRNRVTLDNNALIYQKILDNDTRVEKLEESVFGIKQR